MNRTIDISFYLIVFLSSKQTQQHIQLKLLTVLVVVVAVVVAAAAATTTTVVVMSRHSPFLNELFHRAMHGSPKRGIAIVSRPSVRL